MQKTEAGRSVWECTHVKAELTKGWIEWRLSKGATAQKIFEETERKMKFTEQGGEAIKREIIAMSWCRWCVYTPVLSNTLVILQWNLWGIQTHWACRDEVRKAKVQLELDLARNVKGNKMGFYEEMDDKFSWPIVILKDSPALREGKGCLAREELDLEEEEGEVRHTSGCMHWIWLVWSPGQCLLNHTDNEQLCKNATW